MFPGSSDELFTLDIEPTKIWHEETSLDGFDAIILPGGSSYGDYLRPGSLAAHSNIIPAVKKAAADGKLILGINNGFQILTEIGLLPGGFLRNRNMKFICRDTELIVENNNTAFTNLYEKGERVRIPIAHAEGNYYADEETLAKLKSETRIIFTYPENPDGSAENIAGIINENGNILGIMPQSQRAPDGFKLFKSFLKGQ
jgi:phosphoribosylformylglycinamidine synthase